MLDYSKVCGACSTPLTQVWHDKNSGPECAYLHTRQGRREFEATLKRNRKRQRVVDSAPEVTAPPEVVTFPDAVTVNEVTIDEVVTLEATDETKQQRYRRLNRERVNQRERDRRNHT